MELIRLFEDENHKIYRDPATGICERCPVGSDWGDDWAINDERWERLGTICNQSGTYTRRRTRPDCPIALAQFYLSRFGSDAYETRALLSTAEKLARQRLDPQRVESIKWFEQALAVERDRLAFLAEVQEVA